jgi:hypothetical protein
MNTSLQKEKEKIRSHTALTPVKLNGVFRVLPSMGRQSNYPP